jgi:ApbE superfamily uncharacterized protein (UPF0280 family)
MQVGWLEDGRLHLSDGPIDLILSAEGEPADVQNACRQAVRRFASVLDELVSLLPVLRSPVARGLRLDSPVAQRMLRAIAEHPGAFLTPMIAVAGAVADEILAEMTTVSLRRAYVNNGGDIALLLSADEHFRVGVAETPTRHQVPAAYIEIGTAAAVGGVATSGMDGRSLSLGIADAVTVLARDAASADVAATLIANAVDVDHPAIERARAIDLDPDSDLGERLVTTSRDSLPSEAIDEALSRGVSRANRMLESGAIVGALLACDGRYRTVGSAAQLES